MSEKSVTRTIYESQLAYNETLLKSGLGNKKEIEKNILNSKIAIKMCDYAECKHLWVTLPSEDEEEDRLCGCVKCGLSNIFIPKFERTYNRLSEEEKASYDYLTTWAFYNITGTQSGSWCDLELGMAIYKKIKAAHPEASDEQISDYISYALWKMRTKDQTEKRKASRVRRLGLRPDFNAWNPEFEQE